jgi:LTXXQ motif family protein
VDEVAPPVSQVTSPAGKVEPPANQAAPRMSRVEPPVDEVAPPVSQAAPPAGKVEPPAGQAEPRVSRVEPPASEVEPPVTQVAPPVSPAAPPVGQIAPSVNRMCGDDSRDIADVPIDQIQRAIEPTKAQLDALDDLGNASIRAARAIRDACPRQAVLTAPGRLAAMQQRIEAMIAAVAIMRPPLAKLYARLRHEQKVRFNALATDQRKASASRDGLPQCGGNRSAAPDWPVDEIERRLRPTRAQRVALLALRDANTKAADLIRMSCPDVAAAATPPARLAATAKRLEVILEALRPVRSALDDFYASLSDEQKAQFEGIGRQRPAS